MGVILYEMLTGQLPFEAQEVQEVLIKITAEIPVPPRSYLPDLPQAVEDVVMRALSKPPEERFASMEAMYQALGAAVGATGDTDASAPSAATPGTAARPMPDVTTSLRKQPKTDLLEHQKTIEFSGRGPAAEQASENAETLIEQETSGGPPLETTAPRRGPRVKNLLLILAAGGALLALAVTLALFLSKPRTSAPPPRSRASAPPPRSRTTAPLAADQGTLPGTQITTLVASTGRDAAPLAPAPAIAGPPPDASMSAAAPQRVALRRAVKAKGSRTRAAATSGSPGRGLAQSRRSKGVRRMNKRSTAPASAAGHGWITVVTNHAQREAWAEIYINGAAAGQSPLYKRKLPPGVYTVLARRAGFRTARQRVTVRAGKELKVRLSLLR
jgi:hypothetical protein